MWKANLKPLLLASAAFIALGAGQAQAETVDIADYFTGTVIGKTIDYTGTLRLGGPSEALTPLDATINPDSNLTIHGVVTTRSARTSSLGFDPGSANFFSLTPSGLSLHREEDALTYVSTTLYDAPVVILPSMITTGQSYAFSGGYSGTTPSESDAWTGTLSGTATVVGFESINVPAGTFSALRVDIDTDWSESGTSLEGAYSGTGDTDQTWWLAKGIGLVKQSSVATDSYFEPDSYFELNIEAVTPEPSSLAIIALGGLTIIRRRRA